MRRKDDHGNVTQFRRCKAIYKTVLQAAHADNPDIYILRWPASVEQAARIWTRAADFEPFFVDADVDTDVRLLLESFRKLTA